MNHVLNVKGLCVRFGANEVLRDLSFDLAPDTVNVLLGENGVGKSTLLRCLLGLQRPQAGTVNLLGHNALRCSPAARELVGYVPDDADACGWMTAPELFGFLSKQYRRWSAEKVQELSERLQVPTRTPLQSMSRGEAAKAMLVAALGSQPRLLLLDEAFTRLAPPTREEVLGVFLEEAPLAGGAVLLATHDLEVAARAADRVLLLAQGKIELDWDMEQLLSHSDERTRLVTQLRGLYPARTPEQVR